jgi:hypothetical protein
MGEKGPVVLRNFINVALTRKLILVGGGSQSLAG